VPLRVEQKTLASGLAIEDTKLGTGAVAKSGKKVGMRYIGKLGNGKVFDSNTNGKPFVFLLGKGEVIKVRSRSSFLFAKLERDSSSCS